MTRIVVWATVSLMLLGASCLPRETILPDRTIPHRLAEDVKADIWVRRADGALVKERVRLDAGFWCVAPEVVERPQTQASP